jgi:hypothetical protein
MEAADMTVSPMFSAVGMDVTQNVPQDFSFLTFCKMA